MKTYRIEELDTTGWVLVDDHKGYSKEKTKEVLHQLIEGGHNPNYLRAVPDV